MSDELRRLVDELGQRSHDARAGRRRRPDGFDDTLWRHLEETGLSRLTSAEDAGPADAAIVLDGLARHAAAVPVAETDLLAAWLAARAGVPVPASGPMTVALADVRVSGGRITGVARDVPWPDDAAMVLAGRTADALYVTHLTDTSVTAGQNLAGEPRGAVAVDVAVADCLRMPSEVGEELVRRGAWARCVQIVGALDAAAALTVEHTRGRVQFGRPLSAFQAVQHALAGMAGEIERARATVTLAVTAAQEHGFDSAATKYAVAVAKVAIGRAVGPVTTAAHQLHGAIGVTIEHPLWSVTMRARSWADEFGDTASYARQLGRAALTGDPWDVVVGP
ncbi:acyl-CoA dehydrogenase family protein [Mycobacterium sp. NPDC050041]|uniref:acyl-CoA dehydrogenase family protein n=1 Tax=Mycobacterium sp. NPDC050041 TaxID=3364293 RepID=UPI003C2B94BC